MTVLSRGDVDDFLVAWEEGEYQAQVKMRPQKSAAIRPSIRLSTVGRPSGRKVLSVAERAQAVRSRLERTVQRAPEVMVKITSSCRGARHIGRHIDYISRKGQIDLEDQDGFILRGKDQLKDLKEDWRSGGLEVIGAESDRRDTLNIVFSMPAYTDEVAMKRAVRAFAAAEFDGYQYVFAYHTQATDPDPNPPAHPHVHLSVKTLGYSGRRLNPRKADLQRWREDFAVQLRAHGIEANATSRLARLKREPGRTRAAIAIRERGDMKMESSKSAASAPTRARGLEARRLAYYALAAGALSRSEDERDRQLGRSLDKFIAVEGRPPQKTQAPKKPTGPER